MPSPDPWLYLRKKHPRVEVYATALPANTWALTEWVAADDPVIHLAYDLGRIQRRCVLAHEIQHLEYGRPCRDECPDDELRVIAATARWLLPDLDRVGALLAKHPVRKAATLLDVTRTVLMDRLESLTDDEADRLGEVLKKERQAA